MENDYERYAVMAYAARVNGNKVKSNTYISQARLLCSSVYDQPEIDTGNIYRCNIGLILFTCYFI